MRIIGLEVDNVKRIRSVSIEDPEKNLQIIGGRNGQGKTSLLDSIWLALGGGDASKTIQQPVNKEASTASVSLTIGESGSPQFTVERKWSKKGTTSLKVTSEDGRRYDSPQQMINSLVGNLAYDPLRFLQSSSKDQRETLLSIIDLPFDLDELDQRQKALFDERTAVNRSVRDSEGEIKRIGNIPKEFQAGRDLSDVLNDIKEANHQNSEIAKAESNLVTLQAQEEALARKLDMIHASILAHKKYLSETKPIDVNPLNEQLEVAKNASEMKAKVSIHNDAVKLLNDRRARAKELNDQIDEVKHQRINGLANAQMPLDGLGIEDDEVMYGGIPLSQLSGAEGLRVSLAIAAAQNPDLKVILIRDGSLLDDDSLALVKSFSEEHDVQVWMERVGSADADALIIEDGEVVE